MLLKNNIIRRDQVARPRQAYQLGIKIYKTQAGAARALAWHWIFYKYGDYQDMQNIHSLIELGLMCECNGPYEAESCPLHDRHNGYFRRLHKRLAVAILAHWKREDPFVAERFFRYVEDV